MVRRMKALIQRVTRGAVSVEGQVAGAVGRGYVVLLGVRSGDNEAAARYLAERTAGLRVFPDEQGRMNLSVMDVGGGVLVISQFTLYADTRKGNRPGFTEAASPDEAMRLYGVYVDHLRRLLGQDKVATGVFRASMQVELVNDGPVTIELCTDHRKECSVLP